MGFYLPVILSSKMLIIRKLETAVTEEMHSSLLPWSTLHIQHSPGLFFRGKVQQKLKETLNMEYHL